MRQKTVYAFLIIQVFFGAISAADDGLFPDQNFDPGFTTTIFNVGQGNGIKIFDNQNGRTMIVDAGSSCFPEKKSIETLIPTFLAHVPQITSLEPVTIVVSHPDKDHLNWLSKIIKFYTTNKNITVYLGGSFEKYLISSDAKTLLGYLLTQISNLKIHSLSHALTADEMNILCKQVEKQNNESIKDHGLGYEDVDSAVIQTVREATHLVQKVRPFIVRSQINGFNDLNRVTVEILGANAGHVPTKLYPCEANNQSFLNDTSCFGGEVVYPDENTNSIVLKVTFYNKASIILTGDATGTTTDRLIKNYPENNSKTQLNCDLLIACHHGSITEESNNPQWVKATQPKWVVFSAGKFGSYHHPQFDAVWNYAGSPRLVAVQSSHPILCARVDTRELPSPDKANAKGIFYQGIMTTLSTGKQQWIDHIFCKKGIYSTHSSGTITLNVNSEGSMKLTAEK